MAAQQVDGSNLVEARQKVETLCRKHDALLPQAVYRSKFEISWTQGIWFSRKQGSPFAFVGSTSLLVSIPSFSERDLRKELPTRRLVTWVLSPDRKPSACSLYGKCMQLLTADKLRPHRILHPSEKHLFEI